MGANGATDGAVATVGSEVEIDMLGYGVLNSVEPEGLGVDEVESEGLNVVDEGVRLIVGMGVGLPVTVTGNGTFVGNDGV